MPTAQKAQTIEDMKSMLQASSAAILTDYRGLSVSDLTKLRKKLREVDCEFHIVKNTLFKRAIDTIVADKQLEAFLEGPTAIGFAKKDAVALARTLLDFTKDHKQMSVKAGLIDGKVFSDVQVTALSKLPSREVLIAQMLGSLNSPISGLVGTLQGILSNFVFTLSAIADQKQEAAPSAAS